MDHRMINVGFGNAVPASRVLAVVNPKSSPMKKLKDEAKEQKKLIDVTEGRRTPVQPETITTRLSAPPEQRKDEGDPIIKELLK